MITSFQSDTFGPFALKDPDATLDYQVDWTEWLNGDVIVSATFDIGQGLTKVSETSTDTAATVWVSGGSDGDSVMVTCHVITQAGRQDDRSFRLIVRER